MKSRDLFTDVLQWPISRQGLHTAAPAWIRATGEGPAPPGPSRNTENGPVQDSALYCAQEEFHGQRMNVQNLQSSSPGMEFLLNRATISSYSHCGLTSTSWENNFPPHPLAGQLQQRNKNMQQLYKFKNFICKWSKPYSEYRAWWENSSSVQQNDWAGSSLGQTHLSKKDKKEKSLLGIRLLNIRNTASSNHNSLFFRN